MKNVVQGGAEQVAGHPAYLSLSASQLKVFVNYRHS